jgi:plasmid stability protein
MPDFLIRGLDEFTMKRLKERAERNHRSLQAEIKDILLQSTKLSKEETLEVSRQLTEASKQWPSTRTGAEDIREDRDER